MLPCSDRSVLRYSEDEVRTVLKNVIKFLAVLNGFASHKIVALVFKQRSGFDK